MNLSLNTLFLIFLGLFLPFVGICQSQIEFQARYLFGFTTSEIVVSGDEVETELSYGGDVRLGYAYALPEIGITPAIHIGAKYVTLNGESTDFSYDGEAFKFVMDIGADYAFYSQWTAGLFFHMENNLDFEDWRTGTSDLLRYSVAFQLGYELIETMRVQAGFQTWLYPKFSHYAVYNPAQYIYIGFNFAFQ